MADIDDRTAAQQLGPARPARGARAARADERSANGAIRRRRETDPTAGTR